MPASASQARHTALLCAFLALATGFSVGAKCDGTAVAAGARANVPAAETGHALFTSPQTNPVALSNKGDVLYVANTTTGTLSVFGIDKNDPALLTLRAEIPVGLDPVSVAVRPGGGGDELVLVANHLSDSISVVSKKKLEVVQTIQGLDAEGVTTTNEPVSVVFASKKRAFVALDEPDQVLVIDFKGSRAEINPTRLPIHSKAPRAMTVVDDKLYVLSFESGNQTEFPSCAPDDPRILAGTPLDEASDVDEGCEFSMTIFDGFGGPGGFDLGTIFDFATGPNIGGRVIRDRDVPDRDLYVFDAKTLAPGPIVEGVGTLLYGVAASGDRLVVSNTEARNQLDGLAALENRMFENRVTLLDCPGGVCSAPAFVDLDASASALGGVVPTPYGIAASEDGATLVVTGAGSDGVAPGTTGTPAGQPEIFGLAVLDADGQVQGAVRLGAIPQGVALRSGKQGVAETAYVLNTVDSTLSIVDVSDPANPSVLEAAFPVGADPTPPEVKRGRIAFSTARASSSGTFSCESCHPNANMDQLLWVINTVNGPNDGPDPNGHHAEPRLTMTVRGLRDTTPLHWDGTLGDPFGGMNGEIGRDETADPNCDGNDPVSCFRALANASLSGVMCEQIGGCDVGVATDGLGTPLPGSLTDTERNELGIFLSAVSFPPSPRRRPNEVLTTEAMNGVSDFFTDEDGLGLNNHPLLGGIAGSVGFAPKTCADNNGGCHALPFTASTNSVTVGGFDAPSMRGFWDRAIVFSDGLMSSTEALELSQRCADGDEDVAATTCSPIGANANFPSGADIWDPERGITPLSSHLSSFELIFSLAYGVRGEPMWEFFNEMSVGLPGLLGRQVELSKKTVKLPATADAVVQLEAAADEGKIVATAHSRKLGHLRWDGSAWADVANPATTYLYADLEKLAKKGKANVTFRADLPAGVSALTPQPFLNSDPASIAVEELGQGPAIPTPAPGEPSSHVLGYKYLEAGATVLLDGSVCGDCTLTLNPGGGFEGADVLTLDLPGLPAGIHVVQARNPAGLASNEMPVLAKVPEPPPAP
jgi:DNA-binding beta-propeller fold protein YncE